MAFLLDHCREAPHPCQLQLPWQKGEMAPLSSKDQAEPSSTCESGLDLAFYLSNHYANMLQFPAKTPKEPKPPETSRAIQHRQLFPTPSRPVLSEAVLPVSTT